MLLLLTGCGDPSPMEEARRLRRTLEEATQLDLEADVTADYGERVYSFRLVMETESDGWRVRILEPENLSGVSAVCKNGSLQLEFEDLILDVGDLSPAGLCPMNALPAVAEAWRSGHLSEALVCSQGEELELCFELDDDTQVRSTFRRADLLPVAAEISVGGVTVLFCSFRGASIR